MKFSTKGIKAFDFINKYLILFYLLPFVIRNIYLITHTYIFKIAKIDSAIEIFIHDSLIIASIIILYFFYLLKNKIIHYISRILIIIISGIHLVDFIIYQRFNSRLILVDIKTFLLENNSTIEVIFYSKAFLLSLFLAIPILIISLSFIKYKPSKTRFNIFLTSILILSLFMFVLNSRKEKTVYVNAWIWKNVYELNYYNGATVSYSKKKIERYSHLSNIKKKEKRKKKEKIEKYTYEPNIENEKEFSYLSNIENKKCIDKKSKYKKKKNIIILVVESYSAYHSKHFSGINDFTPNLDKLAKEYMSFTNFYANGFSTNGGLQALLLGNIPLPGTDNKGLLKSYYPNPSLPEIVSKQNYSSEFLTSGDLNFSDKINWLKKIKFDYIEGNEHPYYEDWERFNIFNAAEDKALYNRVLDRVFNVKRNNNFLMVIENLSTHHPFINPENNKKSESETFEYADKQILTLYQGLKDGGFFKDGTLVIVSDHRSMTTLKKMEIEKYGTDKAMTQVPLIIIDNQYKNIEVAKSFQQTDVYNTIENIVSPQTCTNDFLGDLLSLTPPKYILSTLGAERDIVILHKNENSYRIRLNGDSTNFIKKDAGDNDIDYEKIITKINKNRIVRNQEEDKIVKNEDIKTRNEDIKTRNQDIKTRNQDINKIIQDIY